MVLGLFWYLFANDTRQNDRHQVFDPFRSLKSGPGTLSELTD